VELHELLESEGVAERNVCRRVAERARERGQPLISVLVEDEGTPEDVLADVLAKAMGTVVIDVARGTLDAGAVMLIPEEIARRYLLIAVAPGPSHESVQVAFANPLDAEAVRAVRDATGLAVHPLVATVSGVRAAIEREYRKGSTKVIRAPSGRRRETRELIGVPVPAPPPEGEVEASPTKARSSTVPMWRLEQDATMEQRHEALLLSLIEAGALTRADYVRALRRLLGREED
jgi:hypothetical protein